MGLVFFNKKISANTGEICIKEGDKLRKDIFIDSVGNVSVQAGLVRIELMGLDKLPPEGTPPVFEVSERLAMSLETMLRMHGALSEIVNQMESKGLIKKNVGNSPDSIDDSSAKARSKV